MNNKTHISETFAGTDFRVRCNSCGWEAASKIGLVGITNLADRLSPGGVVPAGQCPKCGALAYKVAEGPEKRNGQDRRMSVKPGAEPYWQAKAAELKAALQALLEFDDFRPDEGTNEAEIYKRAETAVEDFRVAGHIPVYPRANPDDYPVTGPNSRGGKRGAATLVDT